MPFFLTLDAYYASKVIVHGLLNSGNHLVTQVRKNAVAYWPAMPSSEKRRGRKRKYGEKVKLRTLCGRRPERMQNYQRRFPSKLGEGKAIRSGPMEERRGGPMRLLIPTLSQIA
jgi:hypothetical protein